MHIQRYENHQDRKGRQFKERNAILLNNRAPSLVVMDEITVVPSGILSSAGSGQLHHGSDCKSVSSWAEHGAMTESGKTSVGYHSGYM